MDKRLGLFLVAFVLIATAIPLAVQAEPTRALGAEIDEVNFSGPMADGGEYAAGTHMISVMINNTGDEDYGEFVDFYVNVTYSGNGTVFQYEMINKVLFVPVNSRANSDLLSIDLPEGDYNIAVNATISLVETEGEITVEILDVVDLSIVNIAFEEGATYSLDEEIFPICNVSFEGNVDDFADTVNIHLLIETDDIVSVTVYDDTMTILTPASPPVSPGKFWPVSFSGWTPNTSGPYMATFSVDYDTYNEANNEDIVSFEIADPPVIEGMVTSDGSPLPGVEVTVSTSPETSTMTDIDGKYYFFDIPAGNYAIEFAKMWASGNVTAVTVVAGETQTIDVTLAMLEVGGLRGTVTLPDNSAAAGTWITISADDHPDITTSANSTGYYEIEEVPAGNITIVASFSGYEDDVINMNIAQGTWNTMALQLGDIPFEVTFSIPDNELAFDVFGSISIFFTRPIERTSVDSTSLILRKLSTNDVIFVIYSFADSDMTVVATPDPPLSYGAEYQIEVTSWVQDTNGNFFPAPVYSTFNTELDIQEAELISFFPLDDANEVPLDVTLSAVFPVAMDGDTINGTTFQLQARGGMMVNSVVTYDPLTKTAYLDPVVDLAYGTRYSVSLDPDMAPLDPSFVFLGFTWSYETEVEVTTGRLVGKILNDDGIPFTPPSMVTIKLSTGVNNVRTRTPNLSGDFEFIDVEEGVWTLSIVVNGYEEYTNDFTINAGETTELPADITMVVADDGKEDQEPPWAIIILIGIVIIVIIVIFYYLMNRPKEEQAEEEEHHHRPRFGGRREEPGYYGEYDDMAEGEFMCPVCGNVVEGEDTICPACGSEFEDDLFECPECGAGIPSEAISCPECDALFEEEEGQEDEEDYYDDEEEIDITEDYEVEDVSDDDFGIAEIE